MYMCGYRDSVGGKLASLDDHSGKKRIKIEEEKPKGVAAETLAGEQTVIKVT